MRHGRNLQKIILKTTKNMKELNIMEFRRLATAKHERNMQADEISLKMRKLGVAEGFTVLVDENTYNNIRKRASDMKKSLGLCYTLSYRGDILSITRIKDEVK